MILGGFGARVGLERNQPKITQSTFFDVFERLIDSTNIANLPLNHFVRDDASLILSHAKKKD